MVRFTKISLVSPAQITYDPVSGWLKILHGSVEISVQNSLWLRIRYFPWPPVLAVKFQHRLVTIHGPVSQYIIPVEILL